MGTTRLDKAKLVQFLEQFVNPFGVAEKFNVGSIMGVVKVNGREERFEIDALEIQAIPVFSKKERLPTGRVRTPPAGVGKIKLAAVNGEAL